MQKRETDLVGDKHTIIAEKIGTHYVHACFATEIGKFELSLDHFRAGLALLEDAVASGYPRTHKELSSLREHTLWGGIGNSLNGLGKDDEAEVAYMKALELRDPLDLTELYEINLCRSWLFRGLLEKAAERLLLIIQTREAELGPDDTKDY